ncbi:hypothetical protein HanIR_Chr01g0048821 [Helianthus annuus]|nr:hypothetical protein HanIR_Chr01g0048821 [Helianthus annuus]
MTSSYCPIIPEINVLAVLTLKKTTCYYLDSLWPSSVNEQLKKIIDMAMVVFAARSGTSMRVKLNLVNARCPCEVLHVATIR